MSVNVNIKIDVQDTVGYFKKLPKRISIAISKGISRAAFTIEREAKIKSPFILGRLRGSIFTDLSPSFMPTRATVGPNVFYAEFVHEGTRFIKANPFMTNAAESKQRQIQRDFDILIDRAIN